MQLVCKSRKYYRAAIFLYIKGKQYVTYDKKRYKEDNKQALNYFSIDVTYICEKKMLLTRKKQKEEKNYMSILSFKVADNQDYTVL